MKRDPEKPGIVIRFLAIILLLSGLTFTGYSQASNNAVDSLNGKINALTERLDRELKLSDDKYEILKQVSDRSFNMFYIFGAVGSILGGILIIISIWQSVKAQKDYGRERKFYEEKIGDHYKLTERASADEAKHLAQQFSFGEKMLAHSDELLTRQVENITKLGDVIALVRDAFNLQIEREKDQKDLQNQQKENASLLSQIKGHYYTLYDQSRNRMFNFGDLSRMAWTRLSPQEQSIINRALTDFSAIQQFVIQEKEKEKPNELARLYVLLGIGAYYLNEIDTASDYLEKAKKIYENHGVEPEETKYYAFCHHFNGLIEKNWRKENMSLEINLMEAEKSLNKANDIFSMNPKEFLTPLTLAEVLTYSHNKLPEATKLLHQKIQALERFRKAADLDANQHSLLGRAYLLMGNVYFIDNKQEDAYKSYHKAYEHNSQNHYALLSMAHVTRKDTIKNKKLFTAGLAALESSDALNKSETTVRVIAITWAILASGKIGNKQKMKYYLEAFDKAELSIRATGNRVPLFFSPLSKGLVQFEDLKNEVMSFVKMSEDNVPA